MPLFFSHILNYYLSILGMECGLLWVFRHHCAFHEDTFHMGPAGFAARPFRQFISARTTKSCWTWQPPFQSCCLSPQASALCPLSLQQLALPAWPPRNGEELMCLPRKRVWIGQEWPLGSALVPAAAVLWGFSPLRGHSSGAPVERGGHGSWGWLLGMSHTAHVPDKDGHYSSECHGPHAAEVSPWAILKMLSHAHFLVHQALVSTMGR